MKRHLQPSTAPLQPCDDAIILGLEKNLAVEGRGGSVYRNICITHPSLFKYRSGAAEETLFLISHQSHRCCLPQALRLQNKSLLEYLILRKVRGSRINGRSAYKQFHFPVFCCPEGLEIENSMMGYRVPGLGLPLYISFIVMNMFSLSTGALAGYVI